MDTSVINALLDELGVSPVAPPSPVTGGWGDARLWRVELAGGPHVLRIYDRYDELIARREAKMMNYLASLDFPVARVAAMRSTEDYALMLIEWIDGDILGDALATGSNSRSLGEEFGRLQGRLHHVEAPDDLPPALTWPSPEAYPEQLMTALELLPQTRNRVVHLDYHPFNVLVRDGAISGLIDWANVRRGDPRFDVARTYLILRIMPGLDAVQKAEFRSHRRAFLCGWHRAYRDEFEGIWDVAPFLAWAGYGLRFDLERKPDDWLSPAAMSELQREFLKLERKIDGWMDRV